MTEGGFSPIPREARPYQGRRAGLVTRVAANVVDVLVAVAILLAAYAGLNGLRFLVSPRSFSFTDLSPLPSVAAVLVVLAGYLTVTWATTGRSYGCHLMGLRVVGRDGRRLGPFAALLRSLFCVLFPLGLLWCAVDGSRRSVQDVVLRTTVVYDWQPRGEAGFRRA